jgi:hypothetical protein
VAGLAEIVGTVMVAHEGDAWTMAICFASEAVTREVDRMEPSAEARKVMELVNALNLSEPATNDFKQAWLQAPRGGRQGLAPALAKHLALSTWGWVDADLVAPSGSLQNSGPRWGCTGIWCRW